MMIWTITKKGDHNDDIIDGRLSYGSQNPDPLKRIWLWQYKGTKNTRRQKHSKRLYMMVSIVMYMSDRWCNNNIEADRELSGEIL